MLATPGLPYTVTSDNGPHFLADSFQTFLKDNGIKHRKITSLWPQANDEIERQNRSLLKRMQIAQLEREDWKKAVLMYLVAYRNTPHPSTGVCPAELLFRRKLRIRTKLPELREVAKLDEEVRDRDRDKKGKMKEYADRTRDAEGNSLVVGDKVLLKQQRLNKWTTPFESRLYELIDKRGNSVLVESPEGTQYKRNTTHVKLYHEREKRLSGSLPEEQTVPQEMEAGDVPADQGDKGRREEDNLKLRMENSVPVKSPRPVRTRHISKKLEDFVLYGTFGTLTSKCTFVIFSLGESSIALLFFIITYKIFCFPEEGKGCRMFRVGYINSVFLSYKLLFLGHRSLIKKITQTAVINIVFQRIFYKT